MLQNGLGHIMEGTRSQNMFHAHRLHMAMVFDLGDKLNACGQWCGQLLLFPASAVRSSRPWCRDSLDYWTNAERQHRIVGSSGRAKRDFRSGRRGH